MFSQAFVTVTSPRDGYSIIQPVGKLYDDHQSLTANGVANVGSSNPFRILIANLGRYPKTMAKNQVVATLLPHPTITVPTHVILADVVDEWNENSSGTCKSTNGRESNDIITFWFKTDYTDNSPKLGTTIPAKSATPPSLDELYLRHVPQKHRENSVRYFRTSLLCGMGCSGMSMQQNITLTSSRALDPSHRTHTGQVDPPERWDKLRSIACLTPMSSGLRKQPGLRLLYWPLSQMAHFASVSTIDD